MKTLISTLLTALVIIGMVYVTTFFYSLIKQLTK
jgi:hypothetical protein